MLEDRVRLHWAVRAFLWVVTVPNNKIAEKLEQYRGAPEAGSIRVLGREVVGLDDEQALPLRRNWGVLFERGALFSSLTVSENVGLPLREHTQLGDGLIDEIAAVKIALTGLPADAGPKYPNELSGGMRKRAALARAIDADLRARLEVRAASEIVDRAHGLDRAAVRAADGW
jgi:ABC-type polar amino acid transport system ATPase subunit